MMGLVMAHEILPGPHPSILIYRIFDELKPSDINIDMELDLNFGVRVYLLVDISELPFQLPPNLLQEMERTSMRHKNLVHAAVYSPSATFRRLAQVVISVLGLGNKLSTHKTYEEAMRYLLDRVKMPHHKDAG
jgi:hypothetical protein